MGYVWQDISPQELTGIARYLLLEEDRPENLETLEDYFPNETVVGQRLRWRERIDKPFTTSVPFRGFSTPMPIGKRPGVSRKEAGMLPLGISFEFTEYDMLLQEALQAGTNAIDLFRPEIEDDVERGMRGAMNRAELLRGKLLAGAGFTVNENGVNETVTAGRNALNNPTASTAWSAPTADPHADERSALNRMRTSQGLTWQFLEVLTNSETYNIYQGLAAVRNSFQSFRVLSSLGGEQVNQLRQEQNLPPIRIIDREIENPNGAMEKLVANNDWIYVPRRGTETVGKTSWGVPQAASLQGINLQGAAAQGPVAYVLEEANPPLRLTVVDAIGVPVLQAPDWTLRLNTNAGL